jgi:hypothetical protein
MNHCSECDEEDETEYDLMILDETGFLPYPIEVESGRILAVNPRGFLFVTRAYEC